MHVNRTLKILRERKLLTFPSLERARLEAVRTAGELLKDQPETFWTGEDWVLEVTDEEGLILYTLTFTARATSATRW